MTRMAKVIAGLTILAKYKNTHIAVEHDIIYAGPDAEQVSADDTVQLVELGWHVSDADCWAIFV